MEHNARANCGKKYYSSNIIPPPSVINLGMKFRELTGWGDESQQGWSIWLRASARRIAIFRERINYLPLTEPKVEEAAATVFGADGKFLQWQREARNCENFCRHGFTWLAK